MEKIIRPMNIAVPKETYPRERRVMVLPRTAKVLVESGHNVFVQSGAGSGINVSDRDYSDAGAIIIPESAALYESARNGMVIKIKAPSAEEFSLMNNTVLFCMLHVEQNEERLYFMGKNSITGVSMEKMCDKKGKRLIDQTDITGQAGVYFSLRFFQKMPNEMNAVILGYGNVSTGAMEACAKLGIKFKIMRRRELNKLPLWLGQADLLINGISWPAKQRERQVYLVTREHIRASNPGMIVLDLAVDFPSPIETAKPTSYQHPSYTDEGRVHICIYGYPGLVPITSSRVYSEQVLPVALAIASNGGLKGIKKIGALGESINRATICPRKFDWNKFMPKVPQTV